LGWTGEVSKKKAFPVSWITAVFLIRFGSVFDTWERARSLTEKSWGGHRGRRSRGGMERQHGGQRVAESSRKEREK